MATSKKYSVDATFIKAAHKEACSDWKTKIEKKFPEVFKPKEVICEFGDNFLLSRFSSPLMIGYGLAPQGLEGKCLAVSQDYKVEVKQHNGSQILVFKKKK